MAQNIESWSYNLSAVTDGTDTSCEAKYVYNAADSWSPPRPVCMNAGYINLGYGYPAKVGYEYRKPIVESFLTAIAPLDCCLLNPTSSESLNRSLS